MKNNQDLFEQRSKNNLLKIFLSSFLTISFFYIAPIFINFADKNFYTKEYTNNSKKILAYALNTKDKNKEEKRKSDASKNLPPAEKGALLYKEQGCFACHSLDGSKMIGPSWKGLFEKQRNFSDGTSTIANEDYLVESIIYPAKRIVKGYPNAMASYKDILSDKDINAIIEYIKTLKD